METESLVILDYSGTLSIRAPSFSHPEHLTAQLVECGLTDLGIDAVDTFWREIVNPTWEEGSTTAIGYVRLLEREIRKRLERDATVESRKGEILDAASCFVDRYLDFSSIDPRWQPLLTWLLTVPATMTVIATDHYAEATDAIIGHLGWFRIEGTAIGNCSGNECRKGKIVVANSADLGAHKADPPFWQMIKAGLGLHALHRVLLVDDFGAHEDAGDDYGNRHHIARRCERTVKTLRAVFQVPVKTVAFAAQRRDFPSGGTNGLDDLIRRAMDEVQRCLPGNHESIQRPSDQ